MSLHTIKLRALLGLRRAKSTLSWAILSIIIGIIIGIIGTIFWYGINFATSFRGEHPYVIYLLPVGAIGILFLYHLAHDENSGGTNLVISSIHKGENIPLRMTPLIFISTIFSHFVGASVGREGAALQLGGSIGNSVAKLFRVDEVDRKIVVLSGMAAAFSALMGTPLSGAIFALELTSVGAMYYPALLPCVISAFTANLIARALGQTASHYVVESIPELNLLPLLQIAVVGILAGLAAILFVQTLHYVEICMKKALPNAYVRAFVLGTLLLCLTLAIGTLEGTPQNYNGAGVNMIHMAIAGESPWYAFLLKIVFTAISIAAAYKGGEIVPSFFIGATLGAAIAPILGLPVSLAAAVGMGAVFCGVTNCPLTALLILCELFGFEAMPYFIIPIAISYVTSGYYSLYRTQKFQFPKFRGDDQE